MTAPRCARCGATFELRDPGDRYCNQCIRDLAKLAPKPEPRWVAPWLRHLQAKDLTGSMR